VIPKSCGVEYIALQHRRRAAKELSTLVFLFANSFRHSSRLIVEITIKISWRDALLGESDNGLHDLVQVHIDGFAVNRILFPGVVTALPI